MTKLRFGLLGTGHWAADTQGAALAARPEVEFVGVWGRSEAKAAALAERYGVRAYADVDSLFADVDAVAFALPPDVQTRLALRAARRGKHLLLDKPLAFAPSDADRLAAEVVKHGVASLVFLTDRYRPYVEEFVRAAARRDDWLGARFSLLSSIFVEAADSPYATSPWRRERGGLWDLGPHALGVLLPVLGPVELVSAIDGPHGTTHVMLRHRAGAVSTLRLSLAAPPGTAGWDRVFDGPDGVVPLPTRKGPDNWAELYGAAVAQLARNVAAGVSPHPCDVRLGRTITTILAATDHARREGRTIKILDGAREAV